MSAAGGEAGAGGVTIYTDGAARGNPGPAGIGVVAVKGGEEVFTISRYIGPGTNNFAEYLAVIAALRKAAELAIPEVTVLMDSELVQRQLIGAYKVKAPKLKELYAAAMETARLFKSCNFVHVPRERNAAADRLANEALDRALKRAKEGTFPE